MSEKTFGIYNIKDLLEISEDYLIELFGRSGSEIYNRIRGIDHREIDTYRERKSLGTERTLGKGIRSMEFLIQYLDEFSLEISESLIRNKLHGRTISLKVKYADFTVHSRSRTLSNHVNSRTKIFTTAQGLIEEMSIDREVRLIGLSVSNLISVDLKQLSLFNSN